VDARVFQTPRKQECGIEVILAHVHAGKAHALLEGDSRLSGHHAHSPAPLQQPDESVKQESQP
jgi:hypothetical protein